MQKERGWLTEKEIDRILIIQEETLDKFGEVAVKEGFLSEAQIEALLRVQKDSYLFFGEALVKIGAISEEDMMKHLRVFNKLKYTDANLPEN